MDAAGGFDEERMRREGAALRRLVRGLLGNDAAAVDDVVQDAWVAALERNPPRRHLGAWLAVVARRLASLRRRADVRRERRERIAAERDAATGARATVDVAAETELFRRVAAAVDELDEPFRTAVVLRFWHGLPPQQLAARLGIPVNTARSRVQRGLERLRARLDRESGGRRAWALPLAAMAGVARR